MSTTATAVEAAPPPKAGKKKLLIVVAAVLLLVLVGGGTALFLLKQKAKAEQEAEDDGDAPAAHAAAKRDPKSVPVFLALESFTVNLADRDADRYAQIGISLELEDTKAGEQIKAFMPAIRNNILMVLSHKRAADLMDRAGKEKLAQEVLRETERAIGFEPGKKKAGSAPIRAVHFSNFIIQ
jgi:flagellar FliL protein